MAGKIIKAKDNANSLPKVSWLKIKVVIDAIPICINPIIDAAVPAVVVKFSSAIGVSSGTLNEIPTNVSESVIVIAMARLVPVYDLNTYMHKIPDINVQSIPKFIRYLCSTLRLILEHNTEPVITAIAMITSKYRKLCLFSFRMLMKISGDVTRDA